MRFVLLILILFGTSTVQAEIPDELRPIVIKSESIFTREFELTQVFDRAKAERKFIYLYLGAEDCPPCRDYGRFLKRNQEVIRPYFDKLLVVDIRSWLRGPHLVFKVGSQSYSFSQFQAFVGGKEKFAYWPFHWFLSPDGQVARQLPPGTNNYMTIEKLVPLLDVP